MTAKYCTYTCNVHVKCAKCAHAILSGMWAWGGIACADERKHAVAAAATVATTRVESLCIGTNFGLTHVNQDTGGLAAKIGFESCFVRLIPNTCGRDARAIGWTTLIFVCTYSSQIACTHCHTVQAAYKPTPAKPRASDKKKRNFSISFMYDALLVSWNVYWALLLRILPHANRVRLTNVYYKPITSNFIAKMDIENRTLGNSRIEAIKTNFAPYRTFILL